MKGPRSSKMKPEKKIVRKLEKILKSSYGKDVSKTLSVSYSSK